MKNYFPEHKLSLCKQYVNTLTNDTWPDNEILKVDGIYNLQVWKKDGLYFAAILNTMNKDWTFISNHPCVSKKLK